MKRRKRKFIIDGGSPLWLRFFPHFLRIILCIFVTIVFVFYIVFLNSFFTKQKNDKIYNIKPRKIEIEVLDSHEKSRRVYDGSIEYDEKNNIIIVHDAYLMSYEDLSQFVE